LNFKQVIRNKKNKHYHWVNDAVREWVEENKLLMNIESEYDEEDESEDLL
jgi:hypothetical protein